jgi:hypothetical protein
MSLPVASSRTRWTRKYSGHDLSRRRGTISSLRAELPWGGRTRQEPWCESVGALAFEGCQFVTGQICHRAECRPDGVALGSGPRPAHPSGREIKPRGRCAHDGPGFSNAAALEIGAPTCSMRMQTHTWTARPQMGFDYNRPAAILIENPTGRGRRQGYRRFWSAAEAIRFAVEEFPVTGLQVCLEVGEERYSNPAIRQLYDSPDYPLPRRARAQGALKSEEPRRAPRL